jgi:hypothetical protein
MRKLTVLLAALALVAVACNKKKEEKPAPAPAPAAKPTETTPTPPAATPPATPPTTPTTAPATPPPPKKETAKPAATPVKPAAASAMPADKKKDVPTDWSWMVDETRGFAFAVPANTEAAATDGGDRTFDLWMGKSGDLDIVVVTFRDKKLTKEDVGTISVELLGHEMFGLKDVKLDSVEELNADYDIGQVSAVETVGEGKTKDVVYVLVAKDVTDNYIMYVGGEESKVKANEDTVFAILGSFEMFSGGKSGDAVAPTDPAAK